MSASGNLCQVPAGARLKRLRSESSRHVLICATTRAMSAWISALSPDDDAPSGATNETYQPLPMVVPRSEATVAGRPGIAGSDSARGIRTRFMIYWGSTSNVAV